MSGYIDAGIYVILASVAFVFLDDLCGDVDPLTALFVMSGVALFCFNLLCLKQLKAVYGALLKNPFLFLIMSAALGMDWLCMIYATWLSDPFITMTSLFVTSAFLGFFSLYRKSTSSVHLWSMLFLAGAMILLCAAYQTPKPGHPIYGALLGMLAGMAFYAYMLSSELLTKRAHLTSLQLLATRFWVLFAGTAGFIRVSEVDAALRHHAVALVVVSLGSLVIPIFFNQQAIRKLGTATTSIVISLVPITTYVVFSFWSGHLMVTNLWTGVFITLALVLPRVTGVSRFQA